MKELRTWLMRARASVRGALTGPNGQGLMAYRAIREAGLALPGPERPVGGPGTVRLKGRIAVHLAVARSAGPRRQAGRGDPVSAFARPLRSSGRRADEGYGNLAQGRSAARGP